MTKEKTMENEAPAQQSPVSEKDLENVSGGLWGITIFDSCQKRFYKEICETSMFGSCPHLIVVNKVSNYHSQTVETITTYSCSKGCFKNTILTCVEGI